MARFPRTAADAPVGLFRNVDLRYPNARAEDAFLPSQKLSVYFELKTLGTLLSEGEAIQSAFELSGFKNSLNSFASVLSSNYRKPLRTEPREQAG